MIRKVYIVPATIVEINNQEFLFSFDTEDRYDKYGNYESIVDIGFDDSTQKTEAEFVELISAPSFVKINSTSIYKTTVVYKDQSGKRKLCTYYD